MAALNHITDVLADSACAGRPTRFESIVPLDEWSDLIRSDPRGVMQTVARAVMDAGDRHQFVVDESLPVGHPDLVGAVTAARVVKALRDGVFDSTLVPTDVTSVTATVRVLLDLYDVIVTSGSDQ